MINCAHGAKQLERRGTGFSRDLATLNGFQRIQCIPNELQPLLIIMLIFSVVGFGYGCIAETRKRVGTRLRFIRQQSGPIVGPEKCENAGRANCIYGSARSQISSAAHTLSTRAEQQKTKREQNERKKERKFYERAGARTAASALVVVAADAVTVLLLLRFELSPGATLGHGSSASGHGKYLHRPRSCIPCPAQPYNTLPWHLTSRVRENYSYLHRIYRERERDGEGEFLGKTYLPLLVMIISVPI